MKTVFYNTKIISEGSVKEAMLAVEDGIISDILPQSSILPKADKLVDLKGNYLAAGFIDTHIHGSSGYGTDNQTEQDLLDMSLLLKEQGVAGFLPTIYPAKAQVMLDTIKALTPAIGKEQGAKIIGFHLEGPFISPQRLGVMRKEDLCPPSVDIMRRFYDAANGHIAAITIAPELENIREVAAFCNEHKIVLQAGHTDATFEQMTAAKQYGIKHITHLFNAMRGINHREPGAAGAALIDNAFSCEVIADGRHIHPAIVAMLRKLKMPQQLVLVTDSLRPTGLKEGVANGEAVVLKDGLFKRKEDDVIAGSALTMLQGVRNLISWGFPIGEAFECASDNPARLHNLNYGAIARGKEAWLISLDSQFNLTGIYF